MDAGESWHPQGILLNFRLIYVRGSVHSASVPR
nr:MAG TPA: hypothetical protein [Caudoviricetes sp.]DAV84920.1 MAG TPA: hypothetical protein [Bacteriophage sp.]